MTTDKEEMRNLEYYNVKCLRCIKSLNQKDLAKALNITTAAYNRKENGQVRFTLDEANMLSGIFGKSIEDIFFNKNLFEN